MATVFYDHLIPWDKLEIYFVTRGVSGEEKIEIIELIDETVHTETLTVILTHLPQPKHEEFIDRFHAQPHHEEHLDFLRTHASPEIEEKIRTALAQVVDELITEMSSE